jgi:hypothetical protein
MKKFFCWAHKKNPAMTLGFVLFHMRPAQSAMGWCSGAGYCKHHHKPHALIFHKDVTEDELTSSSYAIYYDDHGHDDGHGHPLH